MFSLLSFIMVMYNYLVWRIVHTRARISPIGSGEISKKKEQRICRIFTKNTD